MRFMVYESNENYKIYDTYSEKVIAYFPLSDVGLRGDYCDFMNDKYIDKEINAEWFLDEKKRIKYHLDQLRILTLKDNPKFTEHGDGVE